MSDGLAGVMSRINQIRSAFGSRGPFGVTNGIDGGFQQLLRSAGATDASRPGGTSSARRPTNGGSDPLERINIPRAPRKTGASPGASSPEWPKDAPAEAEPYADEFLAAAEETGVPVRVLLAVAWAESGFDPDARSGAGAMGMMQLMPATAAGLGVDPNDPAQNILGGARYLAAQFETFGSWDLAFAAYNAGPGAVSQYGGIPPYSETRSYVAAVNGYLDQLAVPAGMPLVTQLLGSGDELIDLDRLGVAPADDAATAPSAAATGPAADAADSALTAMPTASGQAGMARAGVAPAPGSAGSGSATDGKADGGDLGATGAASGAAARRAEAATLPTVLTTTPTAFGEQLLAHVQRTKHEGGHGHRLNVRLDPPELGQLDVSFELRGEQVFVVVRPEKAEGGALLNQQRERIAQLFAREGLELSSFDVGTNNQSQGRNPNNPTAARAYGAVDLDLTSEVAFTVDRELRL